MVHKALIIANRKNYTAAYERERNTASAVTGIENYGFYLQKYGDWNNMKLQIRYCLFIFFFNAFERTLYTIFNHREQGMGGKQAQQVGQKETLYIYVRSVRNPKAFDRRCVGNVKSRLCAQREIQEHARQGKGERSDTTEE